MVAFLGIKVIEMKTYFIVSDIHAEYRKLIEALTKSGFDLNDENHIFVFGGDALDRGKEGEQVIRFIEKLIKLDRIIGVLGNHDMFLLDLLNDNYKNVPFNAMRNGFDQTLLLAAEDGNIIYTKEELRKISLAFKAKYRVFSEWINTLPAYLEFHNHVLVHGFLDFSLSDWHDTPVYYAVWTRGFDMEVPDSFEKRLIIGHTPNQYFADTSQIVYYNKKLMIDGGAAYGGEINVLGIAEDKI